MVFLSTGLLMSVALRRFKKKKKKKKVLRVYG